MRPMFKGFLKPTLILLIVRMERDLSENHIRDILSDDSSFDLYSFSSNKFVPPTTDSDESDSENLKR